LVVVRDDIIETQREKGVGSEREHIEKDRVEERLNIKAGS
jgi:hypothetical protein